MLSSYLNVVSLVAGNAQISICTQKIKPGIPIQQIKMFQSFFFYYNKRSFCFSTTVSINSKINLELWFIKNGPGVILFSSGVNSKYL